MAPNAPVHGDLTACLGLPIIGEIAANGSVLAADKVPAAVESIPEFEYAQTVSG